MPYTTIHVDVDLSDFDDDDIIEEFERRGLHDQLRDSSNLSSIPEDITEIILRMYERSRTGLSIDKEVDVLCYKALGRIL